MASKRKQQKQITKKPVAKIDVLGAVAFLVIIILVILDTLGLLKH